MNPETIKHLLEKAMKRDHVDIVASMVCCECQSELKPDYGLQKWDGVDRRAWIGVCHTCWKKAWLGDRNPTFFIKYWYGKRIGMVTKFLNPGMSWCHHCRTTWQYVKNHTVTIKEGSGVFCFCEACWKEVDIIIKMDAYRVWWDKWGKEKYTWEEVSDAVMRSHIEQIGAKIYG